MLIIHGDRDIMVPVEAAREHFRLVPQSELRILPDENHFYVFRDPGQSVTSSIDFFTRVDNGQAQLKSNADPQRTAQAIAPFNPAAAVPRAMGPTALVVFALLALATLISEDLTCIWAGVMAAQGRISFVFAVVACLAGIFIGDILLYLAGRVLGRAALRRAPLKWFVREEDVAMGSLWFQRRGMWAILFSRFLPGTRLPTYFAAGLLETGFWKFSFYFLIAAALWTPLLVGLSMWVGGQVIESALLASHSWFLKVSLSAVLSLIAIKLATRLASFRGRRLLVGRWNRVTKWEFWPPWIFYPPIVVYICYLAIKHRSLTLFTCANPSIAAGGFVGESKSAILQGLGNGPHAKEFIARLGLLPASLGLQSRLELVQKFMITHELSFPVVLKPDVGERGSGVAVVRSQKQLTDYVRRFEGTDLIIQEHIAGLEFGVFYYRYPESSEGHIYSVTRKLFPSVVGDGKATLEDLILKDDRAVSMARTYFAAQRDHLWDVPAEGVAVQLVEIGTHCRGSIFLDGSEIVTDPMKIAIETLANGFKGFYFGRFDIRTPSLSDFQTGKNFKVVELNGVTSEATHIYDPKIGLFKAYGILARQWRIAYEIGAQNRRNGAQPTPLSELFGLLAKRYSKQFLKKRERFADDARPIRTDPERNSVAYEA